VERAAHAKFHSPRPSGDLGAAGIAREDRAAGSSSSSSRGGLLRTSLQLSQSALVAGLRRMSSAFGGRASREAQPPSTAGPGITSSGSSSSGGASAEVRQRPSWLPRGRQPGSRRPAAGAAEAAPAPAAASQAAEATSAFGLVKWAGRTQGCRLGWASGGTASPLGRDSSSGGNGLRAGRPAASPTELAAAVPPLSLFQEAAESSSGFDGGGESGGEPAPASGDTAESPSLPPNPFEQAAGQTF